MPVLWWAGAGLKPGGSIMGTGIGGAAIARQTFWEFGSRRLSALLDVCADRNEAAQFQRVFRQLISPWGDRPLGDGLLRPSSISDDQSPFEFSIGMSRRPIEVQVYVEPQADPPGLAGNTRLGRALLNTLAASLDASLDRLEAVEDLFFPAAAHEPFGLWIGASWARGRVIELKAYLNPQAQGPAQTADLMREAARRWGFERQWKTLERAAFCRLSDRTEPSIVSLDLSAHSSARVKVYLRCKDASLPELDELAAIAADYHPGDADRFYPVVAGHSGPFLDRAPHLEFAFVDAEPVRPAAVTLEFPIGAHVEHDEVAYERVTRCLSAFGLSTDAYRRALGVFATRSLHERRGIHAHVTLRRIAVEPRIAVYFAGEAYQPASPQSTTRQHWKPTKTGK